MDTFVNFTIAERNVFVELVFRICLSLVCLYCDGVAVPLVLHLAEVGSP